MAPWHVFLFWQSKTAGSVWIAVGSSHGTSHPMYLNHFWNIGYAQFWARGPKIGPNLAENGSKRGIMGILIYTGWTNVDLSWNQLWANLPKIFEPFLEIWVCPILSHTCVSAFVEILPSLQCKIFQYTFLRQYPMIFLDFFSLWEIQQAAWLQLDHKRLAPSGKILFRPLYPKTEKSLFQMWYTALKKFNQGIYWTFNVSGWMWQ